MNLRAERTHGTQIPHSIPQTIPTPPDESDTTGQVFFDSRMIPTPPDRSDHPHPSFNTQALGSRPRRPTNRPTNRTKGLGSIK